MIFINISIPFSTIICRINFARIIFLANTSVEDVELMTESIKVQVKVALASDTLCQQYVRRGNYLNVTLLQSDSNLASAGALCEQHTITVTLTAPTSQPSSNPSGQPSTTPSHYTKTRPLLTIAPTAIVSSSFIGILAIIILISILRFNSAMLALVMVKKDEKKGHLYNILVVLNDDEEAILENIRHEDIAFFRSTEVLDGRYTNEWIMNDTNDVFERRFEVQFYDQFDLLGQSGVDDVEVRSKEAVVGDKRVKKEVYVHKARLQIGMIIAVKPLRSKNSGRNTKSTNKSVSQKESLTSIYSKNASGNLPERRIPRDSSMTSMSDFHSAPSSPHRQSTTTTYAYKGSPKPFRAGLGGLNSGITSERKDVNTLELAAFYDEELSENERRSAASTTYGLKHETYHEESDDSGEALSLELPLDSLSPGSRVTKERRVLRYHGDARPSEGGRISHFVSENQDPAIHRSRNITFHKKAPFTSVGSERQPSTVTTTSISSSTNRSYI